MTQTPQSPRDWQKENEHLNWLITKATEGMQGEKARADAADAREQRLKETVETAIQLYDMGESSNVYPLLKDILRTLYPDTPAPKEGV